MVSAGGGASQSNFITLSTPMAFSCSSVLASSQRCISGTLLSGRARKWSSVHSLKQKPGLTLPARPVKHHSLCGQITPPAAELPHCCRWQLLHWSQISGCEGVGNEGLTKSVTLLSSAQLGREGKGREGKGREGKGREGKGSTSCTALYFAMQVPLITATKVSVQSALLQCSCYEEPQDGKNPDLCSFSAATVQLPLITATQASVHSALLQCS